MADAYIVRHGGSGGGAELAPLSKPATPAEIKEGYQAYTDEGEVIIGAYSVSDVHPQLNAVSISKSGNNLNISNPSTNGNFVKGYKVYSNGTEVTRVDKSPLVLTDLQAQPYTFNVHAHGVGFIDSPDSNSIAITVYAFVNGLVNLSSDFDFAKTTSGMTFSFVITPNEGYHLPSSVDIRCNGEDVDFSYNPYTGEIKSTVALRTVYSGTVTDGGQLVTPTITLENDDLTTSDVPFAETLEVYDDTTKYGEVVIPAGGYIGVGAEGIVTPQLMTPFISLGEDDITVVDGYLMDGDVFYAETYEVYSDGTIVDDDADATAEQKALFTYELDPSAQWSKQSDGSYKTNTGSSYANTYAHMRIRILAPKATKVKLSYTFYPYNSYVRMYIGKLDTAIAKSMSAPSYLVASSGTGTTTSSVEVEVSAGAHFIDVIKQYNTTSTSSSYYNRYCKVGIEEVSA